MNVVRYLIVRADGDTRVTTRSPRLRLDEVAFRLNVSIPPAWGHVQPEVISIEMPEPPVAEGPT